MNISCATCGRPCHPGKLYCLAHYKAASEVLVYGLDAEIQAKMDAKYDKKKEAEVESVGSGFV